MKKGFLGCLQSVRLLVNLVRFSTLFYEIWNFWTCFAILATFWPFSYLNLQTQHAECLPVRQFCKLRPFKATASRYFFSNSIIFPGIEFLLIKKLEIEKTKTTQYSPFETDIIKGVLVFFISNIFSNKKSHGRKLSAVQLQ